ncbi:MAG: hypothetical protein ACOH5I_00980 [Oligoflexus sp.]
MKANNRNQRRSYFEVQQPFDLFDDLPLTQSQQVYRRPTAPKRPPSTKIWAILGFFMLLAVGAWVFFTFHQRDVKHPFVFVELRAVTPKGNPLAGAAVQFGEQKMGVTDSFGEWRRYLRLRPGSKIRVRMTKAYQGYQFVAENILQVPIQRPDGREAELKTSLSLQLKEQKIPSQQNQRREASTASSPTQLPVGREKTAPSTVQDFRVRTSYLSQNHLAAIDIRHVKFEGQTRSLMERHQAGVLRNRIIPELIAQVDEHGLRMDRQAGWKFLLSYIPYEDDVGFIRGELIWRDHQGKPQKSSFLTNFAKTVEESARNLLQMAKRQVNKHYGASFYNGHWYVADIQGLEYWRLTEQTQLMDAAGVWLRLKAVRDGSDKPVWQVVGHDGSPCKNVPATEECALQSASLREAPPQPRWKVQHLQVVGHLPERAEIYISGYQAYAVRPGQWAYWGDAHSAVMVSVIHQQKIFHRARLAPSSQGQALVLQLPGQTAQYTPPKMPRRF